MQAADDGLKAAWRADALPLDERVDAHVRRVLVALLLMCATWHLIIPIDHHVGVRRVHMPPRLKLDRRVPRMAARVVAVRGLQGRVRRRRRWRGPAVMQPGEYVNAVD